MKQKLLSALLGAAAGAVIAYPREAFEAALGGLTAFCSGVLPALLPLLFLMLLLSSRIPQKPAFFVPMALLCGSPGGARLLAPLCGNKRAAAFYAAVSGTMSPMFLLSTLPMWLNAPGDGPALLAAHLLGALLCGFAVLAAQKIFLRRKDMRAGDPSGASFLSLGMSDSAPVTAGRAAAAAANAMLTACVMVTAGFVLSALVSRIFNRGVAMDAALSVLIEVTGGVRKLSLLSLKREALLPLVSFACGFGGLSIQLQNAAFLSERGVRLPLLFALGLLRGALAALLCRLLIV